MSRKFLTSIDLNSNELQQAVIWKLAAAPASPTEGMIYYNTSDQRYYIRLSTAWHDVTGRLDSITSTTTAITIGAFSGGLQSINISNASGTDSGLMPSTMFNDLLNATNAATPNTIAERDAAGDISFNAISTNDISIINAPVNPTDGVNKQYVDNLITSGLTIKGGIDCSLNPNYPAGVVGDGWYVTVAGIIGGASGEVVEIGDMIIAVIDNAGGTDAVVGASWIILQDNIGAATETVGGYIRISTQAETDAGLDDTTAITPLKLATYVAALTSNDKFAVDIGDGVASSYAVSHGLNTLDVTVFVKEISTSALVEVDVVVTSADIVTFAFTSPPALNTYRVIIAS